MLGLRLAQSENQAEALLKLAPKLFETPEALWQSPLEDLKPWLTAQTREAANLNQSYGRCLLYSDKNLEIMLAKWKPGMECLPHDHGFSEGRVVALEGSFTEFDFGWREGALLKLNQRQIESPCVMSVRPGQTHSMICRSKTGLTLHIYRPAISEMKVFCLIEKCTYLVTDDCGAWMPQAHQIISKETWGWSRA